MRSPVRVVASVSFLAVTNAHSAIVPLGILPPWGQLLGGQTLTNTEATGGRIIVVGAEPVMDISSDPILTLYGHPGDAYLLQYRTNLAAAPWLDFLRFPLAGRVVQITNLPANPMIFIRAYQTPAFGLETRNFGAGAFGLTLQGQAGAQYTIQTATNLLAPFWSDLYNLTLTNSPAVFDLTNSRDTTRFFRALQK